MTPLASVWPITLPGSRSAAGARYLHHRAGGSTSRGRFRHPLEIRVPVAWLRPIGLRHPLTGEIVEQHRLGLRAAELPLVEPVRLALEDVRVLGQDRPVAHRNRHASGAAKSATGRALISDRAMQS